MSVDTPSGRWDRKDDGTYDLVRRPRTPGVVRPVGIISYGPGFDAIPGHEVPRWHNNGDLVACTGAMGQSSGTLAVDAVLASGLFAPSTPAILSVQIMSSGVFIGAVCELSTSGVLTVTETHPSVTWIVLSGITYTAS